MHPVSGAQLNHILSLLDSGHSAHDISPLTGLHHTTISRLQRKHHPYLQKAICGCSHLTVVWSDETKINRLGSDGRRWAWKKAGEGLSDRLVEGTLKFGGGSLMMWGCMLCEGVGFACKIDGNMDGELYTKILQDELQETLTFYGKDPSTSIFQQDNDPSASPS